MPNLHAAIGLAQLTKMPDITYSRQIACRLYNHLLSAVEQVITPKSDFTDVTPFLYYIRVPAEHRQNLRDYLVNKGVDTGIHWIPGHNFSLLKDCRRGEMTVTDVVGEQILSLPLHSTMLTHTVELICENISGYFKQT